MHIDVICRVCLKEGIIQPIVDSKKTEGGEVFRCLDMLLFCTSISVSQNDGFPQNICGQCFKKLYSAFKFRRLCEKSYSLLLDYAAQNLNILDIKEEKEDIITEATDEFKEESSLLPDSSHLDLKDEDLIIKEGSLEYEEENKRDINNEIVSSNICYSDDDYVQPDGQSENSQLDSDDDYIQPKKKGEKKKVDSDDDYVQSKKKSKNNSKIKIVKPKSCNKSKDENAPRKKKKRNFKCPCSICPRAFENEELLLAHHDSHTGIKRYYCQQCKKSYRSEKVHKNMHKKAFDYKCEICSKLFNSKAKLNIHVETHNKNREKLMCGINGCTNLYTTPAGLDKHKSSFHYGLRNSVCHICSKRFTDKYQLEGHIRTHSNDKRYPCRYCEKKFINSSHRSSHEKRHKNVKDHKCTECDKSFVAPCGLRRHMLCHTKQLKEACRFCSKRFSRLDNRKRHESVMHGVSDEVDKEKN